MHRIKALFIATTLFCLASLSYSLPGDRNQPIKIESDQAERDEKKGTIVYQGNVIIKQGTILIRADKVIVYSGDEGVSKVVCMGKPAHYQQLPKKDSSLVLANGNTIEYHPAVDKIHLIENASLEQDGTIITGEQIDYDVTAEVLKAKSDNVGKQRIQMIIPPAPPAKKDSVSPKKDSN